MIYSVCSYFDKQLDKFNPPFMSPFSLEDTEEQVKDGAIKGKIENASVMVLYHLGYFDTADGKFKLNEAPKKCLDLEQYVRKE